MALPTGATLAVRLPHAAGVVDALRWLLASRDGAPLGLDVEGTVSLLQLSTPTRAVLLRWRALVDDDSAAARDGFAAVCALLADAAVQKVGCELRQDALVLLACSSQRARLRNGRDFTPALPRPNAPPGTVLGLFEAYNAQNAHPEPPVKDIASRDSDWDAVTLTRAQLEYAALDAWMSHRLGCHAELAADKRVVSIDITAVSTELEGAWEKLSGFKALRRRGTEVAALPDILALPDENDIAPQWLTLPSGERVLLCSAFGGPPLLRGQYVTVKLGPPHDAPWKALVFARRRRTVLLCADPDAPPQPVPEAPKVHRINRTKRSTDAECERLKSLTHPVAAAPPKPIFGRRERRERRQRRQQQLQSAPDSPAPAYDGVYDLLDYEVGGHPLF